MTRLRVIDLETTGTEPPAEIIEFGRVDVVITDHGASVEPPQSWLYRPLRGIPPETMAVHHITEADFGPATPVCTPDQLHAAVWSGPAPAALVAHTRFIPTSICLCGCRPGTREARPTRR